MTGGKIKTTKSAVDELRLVPIEKDVMEALKTQVTKRHKRVAELVDVYLKSALLREEKPFIHEGTESAQEVIMISVERAAAELVAVQAKYKFLRDRNKDVGSLWRIICDVSDKLSVNAMNVLKKEVDKS